MRPPKDAKSHVRGNPPYAGEARIPEILTRFEELVGQTTVEELQAIGEDTLGWSMATIEEFVAAGILIVEGAVPPLPPGWPLIAWARSHVSNKMLEVAVIRGQQLTPAERGQYLRKAIDGDSDDSSPRTEGGV